jgi:superfamily II DNA helicase RecQ
MPLLAASTPSKIDWTNDTLREVVFKTFGKRPCKLQMDIARAVHSRKDVLAIAPTGAGKSLTMYMPFLMACEEGATDSLVIIASPLNNLAAQVVSDIENVLIPGVCALAFNGKNRSNDLYEVRPPLLSYTLLYIDIEAGHRTR